MLKKLNFSDIILSDGDTAFLKGVPGRAQQLIAVGKELSHEIRAVFEHVSTVFEKEPVGSSVRIFVESIGICFRAACYNDVSGKVFFLRRLADAVPDLSTLGLPSHIVSWLLHADHKKGLVLIAGAQASGKTTTAAALVKSRLFRFGGHGVTFEHPVEMPLSGFCPPNGFCFQTDIASEAELAAHIERSHRYSSPNIIFIGEIRSMHAASESLRSALGSSQQLVVATIHGISATAALDRLLTWARELDGEVACRNLAETLTAVIWQELKDADGKLALNVPEFLLLPFGAESQSVRAKLREGNLYLQDEIRSQKNRLRVQGVL